MENNKAGVGLNRIFSVAFCVILGLVSQASAQQLSALARLDSSRSGITQRASGDIDIALKLTQAVPYRIFTLDQPPRLVMDFREVNWSGATSDDLLHTDLVRALRFGVFRPGWSRMVLMLVRPMAVHRVAMITDPNDGDALIEARLTAVDPEVFAANSGEIADDAWALPEPFVGSAAKTRQNGERRVIVALDPGHGGFDPGAQYSEIDEANLMLQFARELKEKLILSSRYEVILTRDEDVFLSLAGRVSKARAAGADVFLSLHADALTNGRASGTTVYTLSEEASDEAAATLAANHDRNDLLAGVALDVQDDVVAGVLMDMARIETAPRSEKLAEKMVLGIGAAVGKLRSRPHLRAGFSVLKAPDIPSVLVELGFMSNSFDLNNLATSAWRNKVANGILSALDEWSIEDAASAGLLRQ